MMQFLVLKYTLTYIWLLKFKKAILLRMFCGFTKAVYVNDLKAV